MLEEAGPSFILSARPAMDPLARHHALDGLETLIRCYRRS
jgi:hypothetical protein